MADLIVPGVWWLHGTRGSNVYLVEAEDGRLAVVDTGFGSNVDAILEEVASVGGGRPLAGILLTHDHYDHTGSALELQRRTGATVAAGAADCYLNGDGQWMMEPPTGRSHVARFVSRLLVHRHRVGLPIDAPLGGETEVLPGIRAIPAPGHTRGSYSYVSTRAGAAFVGDLVIGHRWGLSRPMAMSNADNAQYEATLASFAEAAPPVGCPGHGHPVVGGFPEALRVLAGGPTPRMSLRRLRQRFVKLQAFAGQMYRRRSRPR
jgi:glyoxylase-like metal-dependent hydrolase (beta-lactamase superfamily II)